VPERIALDDLLARGRLKRHRLSAAETRDLLAVADRHLRDASLSELSDEGRFTAAYGAVLALATIVIGASGYRVGRVPGHHRLTIDLLPVLLGARERTRASYFDACRRKRNQVDYERAGAATAAEVEALIEAAAEFRQDVLRWLESDHPLLSPG
jgi:hypothetical protein